MTMRKIYKILISFMLICSCFCFFNVNVFAYSSLSSNNSMFNNETGEIGILETSKLDSVSRKFMNDYFKGNGNFIVSSLAFQQSTSTINFYRFMCDSSDISFKYSSGNQYLYLLINCSTDCIQRVQFVNGKPSTVSAPTRIVSLMINNLRPNPNLFNNEILLDYSFINSIAGFDKKQFGGFWKPLEEGKPLKFICDDDINVPIPPPVSSEPVSSEPTSSEPTSSEPTSSEPTSSEPTSSEPSYNDKYLGISPDVPNKIFGYISSNIGTITNACFWIFFIIISILLIRNLISDVIE